MLCIFMHQYFHIICLIFRIWLISLQEPHMFHVVQRLTLEWILLASKFRKHFSLVPLYNTVRNYALQALPWSQWRRGAKQRKNMAHCIDITGTQILGKRLWNAFQNLQIHVIYCRVHQSSTMYIDKVLGSYHTIFKMQTAHQFWHGTWGRENTVMRFPWLWVFKPTI